MSQKTVGPDERKFSILTSSSQIKYLKKCFQIRDDLERKTNRTLKNKKLKIFPMWANVDQTKWGKIELLMRVPWLNAFFGNATFNYLSSSKFRPKLHKNVHFKPWLAFWHGLCLYLAIWVNAVDLPEPPQSGSVVRGEIYWRMSGIWNIVQSQLLFALYLSVSPYLPQMPINN